MSKARAPGLSFPRTQRFRPMAAASRWTSATRRNNGDLRIELRWRQQRTFPLGLQRLDHRTKYGWIPGAVSLAGVGLGGAVRKVVRTIAAPTEGRDLRAQNRQ